MEAPAHPLAVNVFAFAIKSSPFVIFSVGVGSTLGSLLSVFVVLVVLVVLSSGSDILFGVFVLFSFEVF